MVTDVELISSLLLALSVLNYIFAFFINSLLSLSLDIFADVLLPASLAVAAVPIGRSLLFVEFRYWLLGSAYSALLHFGRFDVLDVLN